MGLHNCNSGDKSPHMNAKFLAAKMAERGMGVAELARALDMTPSYVRMMLAGLKPARHTLRLISLVLQCDVADLIQAERVAV
mgnify:CR=1 FL=1